MWGVDARVDGKSSVIFTEVQFLSRPPGRGISSYLTRGGPSGAARVSGCSSVISVTAIFSFFCAVGQLTPKWPAKNRSEKGGTKLSRREVHTHTYTHHPHRHYCLACFRAQTPSCVSQSAGVTPCALPHKEERTKIRFSSLGTCVAGAQSQFPQARTHADNT